MSETKIMLGNEAIARGAYEAGVKVSAAYPGTPSTEISENIVNYPEIYAEWSPNEKVAMEVAEQFGSYLGRALISIATILDPNMFVIGGGVSKAGEVLLYYIEKYYREKALWKTKDVKFALATLGNDAGIYGAAKMALDRE